MRRTFQMSGYLPSLIVLLDSKRLFTLRAPAQKALARGQMRFIGTARLEDYCAKVEKDAAFQRRLQEIVVR
jgi:hypothetical protein